MSRDIIERVEEAAIAVLLITGLVLIVLHWG